MRWILHVLRAIPLTPCWARARRRQDRRKMVEHLRRYYANGQEHDALAAEACDSPRPASCRLPASVPSHANPAAPRKCWF